MTSHLPLASLAVRYAQYVGGKNSLRVGVGIVTLLLATLYMGHMLSRGWIPHDEGFLAQSAERVMGGEIPHRDFDEAYTGGLSYLNAAAFRLWGTNLMSMRLMLFVFFTAWVPLFYYGATRILAPIPAGAITLAAVAWGPPNYAAALPSWYNLFFATAVVAAVFRFLEVRSPIWLFIAGLFAGTSILFKSVGLYSIASVLLFLLFYERTETEAQASRAPVESRSYSAFLIGAMVLFAVALWFMIRPRLGPSEAVHFLIPGLLVTWLVTAEEKGALHFPVWDRVKSLMRLVTPFCLGAALPIVMFLIPFVTSGAVGALWAGLAGKPLKRLAYAAAAPPPLVVMLPSLCLALAVFWPARRGRTLSVVMPWILALLLGFFVIEAWDSYEYQLAWESFYCAPPIVVAAGVLMLRTRRSRFLPLMQRHQAMLVLSTLALFTLIQFPFSRPVYFCYIAPLLFLAIAAIGKLPGGLVIGTGVPLSLFAISFALLRVAPGFVYSMGIRPAPDEQTTRLTIPRAGGLRVTPAEAAEYSGLVGLVRDHSAPGSTILALPDSPEVYFLTQRRNPTPRLFDFLDPSYPNPEQTLEIIESRRISLIVLNARPAFSDVVDRRVLKEATSAYPRAATVGRFTVRWQ